MSNRYTPLTDRALFRLHGAETRDFLQGLISCDIRQLTPEQAIYGAMLTPQGKYFADFFLVEDAHLGVIWCDVDASLADDFYTALIRYRMRANVTIEREEAWHVIAAWGELAQLGLPETEGNCLQLTDHALCYTDPRYTPMGARIIGKTTTEEWLQERGFGVAIAKDYEKHRLNHGIPHASKDFISGKSLLLENGMEELHGVSFTKGCFVGQEVTARSKHRANLRKMLYQVQSTDGTPLPPEGTAVMHDGKEVGTMRSTLKDAGMALIRIETAENILLAENVQIKATLPAWRKP